MQSPRLVLRRLRRSDAEGLCAYRSLPEVARFQSWESFGPEDAARLFDEQEAVEPDTPGTWLQLALVEIESGALIGDCGLHFCGDDQRQAELGITLDPRYQGRGLAAEALNCVLGYLFDTLGKHRVFAITDAENQAAAKLFRRLGFRQEAHFIEHVWFKGAYDSEFLFALLCREWRERKSAR
ncbi:MAG TPA: GNAT family protein [Gammaproteobacteria bacterium]|nr:GNAT family protein [Gammaproteobacteria bacterium]